MSRKLAVATLLYSLDYLPGVLTLGHQINIFLRVRNDSPAIERCLLVTEQLYEHELSVTTKNALHTLYNRVILINPLMENETLISNNNENLEMLQRPELAFTLIKIKLWNQVMYDQILYLDADTLPMTTDLFDLFAQFPLQTSLQVAASPDIGWPDMFNSGVMLLTPNERVYHSLHRFTIDNVSIDGADQGILNQFFNQNCRVPGEQLGKRQWQPLPFLYNVTTPNTGYQCPPAMKYFQQMIKLIHFIGNNKPWKRELQVTDENSNYAKEWYNVYEDYVAHTELDQGLVEARPKEVVPYVDPVEQNNNAHEYHEEHHEEHHEQHHEEYHEHHEEHHEHHEHHEEHHNEPIVEPHEEEYHEPQHEPESEKIDLPLQFKDWLTTFISKEETPVPIPHDDNIDNVTETSNADQAHAKMIEPPYSQQVGTHDYEEKQFSSSGTLNSDDESDAESIISDDDDNLKTTKIKRKTQPPTPPQEYVPNYKFAWEQTDYQKKVERIFPGEIFEYEVEEEDDNIDDAEIDKDIEVAQFRRQIAENEAKELGDEEEDAEESRLIRTEDLVEKEEQDELNDLLDKERENAHAIKKGTQTTQTPRKTSDGLPSRDNDIPERVFPGDATPMAQLTLTPVSEEPSEYNSDYGDE